MYVCSSWEQNELHGLETEHMLLHFQTRMTTKVMALVRMEKQRCRSAHGQGTGVELHPPLPLAFVWKKTIAFD